MSKTPSNTPPETANDNIVQSALTAFNAAAAPFLDARLLALDLMEVDALKTAFEQRLNNIAKETLTTIWDATTVNSQYSEAENTVTTGSKHPPVTNYLDRSTEIFSAKTSFRPPRKHHYSGAPSSASDQQDTDIQLIQARQAAYEYAYALSLNRGKVSSADITNLLQSGANDLHSAKDALLEKFHELDQEIRKYQRRAEKIEPLAKKSIFNLSKIRFFKHAKTNDLPAADSPDALPWDEKGRIYMRLEDNSQSPVRALIEERLTERGFTITDYTAGRALDRRKNEWKIGRILKDEPALLQAYSDDPSRRNQRMMVVLTRNVTDLARASFSRGWQSCRTDAGKAANRGVAEARAGVIMAYLVSENDPDIHNPYSRISLKPYDLVVEDDKSPEWELGISKFCTMYAAFNPIGLHHPGFAAAVNDFAENTFNDGKVGRFKLRADCEAYRELKERTRLPEDAQAALDQLGATTEKKADGQIKVIGKLDMKGFGLCKLPAFFGNLDLSECDLDLSRNRLLTLEGLPQGAIKSLNVSSNLLVCFAGACDTVTDEFNYRDNHWLMTAYGAPKADTYKYGNSSEDFEATGSSKHCVCPTQKPEAFPGFKRKN